jgi:hypothetical protein
MGDQDRRSTYAMPGRRIAGKPRIFGLAVYQRQRASFDRRGGGKRNVPVLWLLVRPCLWEEFEFLRETQSAVALTPCLAGLERWQQDQVFVNLCQKIKSSAWQLQIELEPGPLESDLVLTLSGRIKYSAPPRMGRISPKSYRHF